MSINENSNRLNCLINWFRLVPQRRLVEVAMSLYTKSVLFFVRVSSDMVEDQCFWEDCVISGTSICVCFN